MMKDLFLLFLCVVPVILLFKWPDRFDNDTSLGSAIICIAAFLGQIAIITIYIVLAIKGKV